MIIGGILEWVLGNSFASIVFCTFGGFWLSYGGTLVPSFNAYGAYATPGGEEIIGLTTRGFNASIGEFDLPFLEDSRVVKYSA
jgi:succinate-acetate transporter protein